jgi:hypothetical protein
MEWTTAYPDSGDQRPVGTVPDGRSEPTRLQWPVLAATWLLAEWTAGATPGWRSSYATGTAPDRHTRPWPVAPPLDELTGPGGLPEHGSGRPVDARMLTSLVQSGPGQPFQPDRPPPEANAELVDRLRERIPVPDERAGRLLAYLAGRLADEYHDLLLIDTGDADLHLLQRGPSGETLRLTVAAAATVEPAPQLADAVDPALRARLACLCTLLSELLWVNNNNPVDFRVRIDPRPATDPATAAALAWTGTDEASGSQPPRLSPITLDELRTGLRTIARGGLTELHDGYGGDGWPELPPDHIVVHLCDDLIDLLAARTGGPAGQPLVYHTGDLPLTWPDDGEEATGDPDPVGAVMFVGDTEVAVLVIDLDC